MVLAATSTSYHRYRHDQSLCELVCTHRIEVLLVHKYRFHQFNVNSDNWRRALAERAESRFESAASVIDSLRGFVDGTYFANSLDE